MIQSNCLISVGPLFLERIRTVTGGPHRWLIACLIDSRATVSQMPFLLLFALTPFGQRGRSTRLPFVASSCRLLLHLPSTHPFPRFLPVPCPDTSQVHRTYARWALTYTMMPPESISCANLVENLLASRNRIEPYHYRAHRGFS